MDEKKISPSAKILLLDQVLRSVRTLVAQGPLPVREHILRWRPDISLRVLFFSLTEGKLGGREKISPSAKILLLDQVLRSVRTLVAQGPLPVREHILRWRPDISLRVLFFSLTEGKLGGREKISPSAKILLLDQVLRSVRTLVAQGPLPVREHILRWRPDISLRVLFFSLTEGKLGGREKISPSAKILLLDQVLRSVRTLVAQGPLPVREHILRWRPDISLRVLFFSLTEGKLGGREKISPSAKILLLDQVLRSVRTLVAQGPLPVREHILRWRPDISLRVLFFSLTEGKLGGREKISPSAKILLLDQVLRSVRTLVAQGPLPVREHILRWRPDISLRVLFFSLTEGKLGGREKISPSAKILLLDQVLRSVRTLVAQGPLPVREHILRWRPDISLRVLFFSLTEGKLGGREKISPSAKILLLDQVLRSVRTLVAQGPLPVREHILRWRPDISLRVLFFSLTEGKLGGREKISPSAKILLLDQVLRSVRTLVAQGPLPVREHILRWRPDISLRVLFFSLTEGKLGGREKN